ncbi:MAG: glycosyltransferase family 2 protein, partial [Acidimicrobiaceae bacterium]|nr:glycosyltransferase family 2 protein [Acidimicrobiaceae bacterium]
MTCGVMTGQQPLVSALVVSHNVTGLLKDTLRALSNDRGPDLEVIVVDNNSAEDPSEAVGLEFPEAKLIPLPENVGYGRANNVAFEHAKGDLILLLNPDVTVSPGCVEHLVNFLRRHPDAGVVGPRVVRPDGSPDLAARRSFPTPCASLFRLLGLSRLFPGSSRFNRYNLGAL